MKDLISVIIPVYRVETYLRRCVDSVLVQTYRELEVILVDDGSPDGCPAICDAYAEQDPRVRVIHQENRGLSGARNAGIDCAKGAYLAFVDSDDYLAADFVERLHTACVETNSDLAVCRFAYVKDEGSSREGLVRASSREGTGEARLYTGRQMQANLYLPEGVYYVVAWNKLYKRELFDGIRYPQGRIHEDEATTYRVYERVAQAVYLDSPLYGYFVAPSSITRGFNPRRTDWIRAQAERVDFYEEKGYRELMVPALKSLADGSIHICLERRRNLKEGKGEQRWIRDLIRQGLKRIKPYGDFPLQTRIGYRLFLACPGIYEKLLNRVKDESGKQ